MKAEVKVPAVGESVTEATIAEWLKSSGDYVERDEPLLSLETDKASVEVVAENDGVLSISTEEGETVEVGTVVGTIDTEAKGEKKKEPKENKKTKEQKEEQPEAKKEPSKPAAEKEVQADLKEHMAPSVRKIVEEKGLDPNQITGTGKGGRLTKEDVAKASSQKSKSPQPATPEKPKVDFSGKEEITREPMSQLRKTVAKRLVEAQQNAAILTTFNEIDMSEAMKLRKRYKDQFQEKYGIKLGFMGLFAKAAIEALKAFPRVNASIEGEEIVYRNFVNLGIAVSTDKGLLVPVIQHADKMSMAQIEQSVMHYAGKGREGKISVDDLSGGTFTISNGGVFGSMLSTPILNPPQSGILGLHKIEERPIAVNGQVEIRPMMYVALSYDHRIIDGRESVSFLVRIKECMEDPSRILLEI